MFIHQQSGQQIHAVLGQPISTDTCKIQDLLPKYLSVLKDTPEYVQVLQSIPAHVYEDQNAAWWTEEAPHILEDLTEALNQYAPEGYYFGNTDNLTDYGYWSYEESFMADGWECTDPDTGQWAKKKDEFSWYYFDNWSGPDTAELIDVRNYSIKQIETTISSYGYTLKPNQPHFICKLYDDSYLQIIAECLFEDGYILNN